MDFSAQATGGNLTVAGQNFCGEGLRSPEFFITVNDCQVNPAEISIPNSFSPNGDGVNEVFFIRGLPENAKLFIFDGQAIHYLNHFPMPTTGMAKTVRALHLLQAHTGMYFPFRDVRKNTKGFVYLKR